VQQQQARLLLLLLVVVLLLPWVLLRMQLGRKQMTWNWTSMMLMAQMLPCMVWLTLQSHLTAELYTAWAWAAIRDMGRPLYNRKLSLQQQQCQDQRRRQTP
jgi:hypothetical protein